MEALLKYVEQCQEYHAIAFFQWRYRFPSKYSNSDATLEQLIVEKMARLWNEFQLDEHDESKQAEIKKRNEDFGYSLLPYNFERKYKDVIPEGGNWNINSF